MSDARAYAQRNQRGNDWFSHDATTTAPPKVEPAAPEPKVEDSSQAAGRTQMIKPKCDSNNWFKHEHNAANSTGTGAAETAAAAPAPAAEPALMSAAAPPAAAAAAETSNKVSREENSRRDKAGSSASWFTHDHTDSAAGSQKGPRVTTTEGGANASRMRGESENWFSYDQNKPDQSSQGQVSRAAANRAKAQGDSMRGIFNMD